MAEKSSRREFLRAVSLAGAAVAIAGGAGCGKAPEVQPEKVQPKAQMRLESDGTIVVEDPALIAALDSIYHDQVNHGKVDKAGSPGFRTKFEVTTSTGEDCPGSHTVNMLCKC